MKATIGRSIAKGEVTVNPSKSILHRYIIGAALSKGRSVIKNVSFSEDIKATLDCVMTLGATVEIRENEIVIDGDPGLTSESIFKCRESGSTLRFFMPISLLFSGTKYFYGSERLLSRPQSVYEDIFKEQGIVFTKEPDRFKLSGTIEPGEYTVEGNVSSQFITGLLFTLPNLKEGSIINIIPPLESRSYINITVAVLKDFGVNIEWLDDYTLKIPGNSTFTSGEFTVEGDCSNAAFLDSFNFLLGDVTVNGLNKNSLQGDRVYVGLLNELDENEYPTIDISDCPDLGPILFTMAALKNGAVFNGTRRLAIKESDRVKAMCEELSKVNVRSEIKENSCTIFKSDIKTPSEHFDSHNDHRIVMSMAVLSSVTGGVIEGAEAVNKSFPEFFDLIKKLGIEVTLNE